jgi:hypothetical protein
VNDDIGRRCCVSAHSPNLHCSMLLCFTLLAMHVKEEIAALRYHTPNMANTQILLVLPSVRSTTLHSPYTCRAPRRLTHLVLGVLGTPSLTSSRAQYPGRK